MREGRGERGFKMQFHASQPPETRNGPEKTLLNFKASSKGWLGNESWGTEGTNRSQYACMQCQRITDCLTRSFLLRYLVCTRPQLVPSGSTFLNCTNRVSFDFGAFVSIVLRSAFWNLVHFNLGFFFFFFFPHLPFLSRRLSFLAPWNG